MLGSSGERLAISGFSARSVMFINNLEKGVSIKVIKLASHMKLLGFARTKAV